MKVEEIDSLGTTIGYVNAMPGKVSMGINMAEITVKLIDKDKRMSHRSFVLLHCKALQILRVK